jgi:hypothetical protein
MAASFAESGIDRRLAQIDWAKLAVQIGDMQQRDVAEPREIQQLRFR